MFYVFSSSLLSNRRLGTLLVAFLVDYNSVLPLPISIEAVRSSQRRVALPIALTFFFFLRLYHRPTVLWREPAEGVVLRLRRSKRVAHGQVLLLALEMARNARRFARSGVLHATLSFAALRRFAPHAVRSCTLSPLTSSPSHRDERGTPQA